MPWWAAVKPVESVPEASTARGGVPPAAGGRAQGAGADAQSDSQSTAWWRSVLSEEPALAASAGPNGGGGEAEAEGEAGGAEAGGAASRARAEAAVLEGVRSHEYLDSPLLALRAGRLGAFYASRAGGGLALSGSFGRQRLDPNRPVCRFELRGDCRDPNCSGQHRRQYLQSVPELCVELRAYAGDKAGEAGALPPAAGEEEHLAQEAAREAASSLRARMPAAPAAAPVVAAASLVALRARAGPLAQLAARNLPTPPPFDAADGAVAAGASAASAAGNGADNAARTAGGGGAARPSLASSARREREAQMQLLHAALSALPAPSLLQGDLEKQLQPLLLARRASEAAALEA